MKIQVKTESVVEKEIEFPYFFKHHYGNIPSVFFALFDEEKSMRVDSEEIKCYQTEVCAANIGTGQKNNNLVEITEEEFTTAFEQTMERIQSMLPVTK